MSTPKSAINESTSVWIHFDHDATATDDDAYEDSVNPNPLNIIQKRVLFVSLIHLYSSHASIPSFILENALFAFGIKRSWIFPSTLPQIHEANNTYIQHFKANWSPQFMQIIKDKDEKGHILWIEPCPRPNTATEQFWTKISNQLTKIADTSILKEDNKNNIDDIADIPMFNIVPHKSPSIRPSKEPKIKQTAKPNKILSISQQILNPSKACVGFTFTQYTDDDDADDNDDNDVSSDSDFEDEQKTGPDQQRCCRLTVPLATHLLEDKSRPSQHDLFGCNYLELKLDKSWWINKYEESRKKQCCLGTDALTDRKSKDLTDLETVSRFDISAHDIIKQIECIGTAKDFQFGPLKELFFQSNPTLIPMDNFDINMYVESHSDNVKYVALLRCCKQYLCPDPYAKYNDVSGNDDGHESDYSISMDLIQQKSNSLLPCGGKIRHPTSPDVKLFDSEDCDKQNGKILTKTAVNHRIIAMDNDTSESAASAATALSNSALPFGGKIRSDLELDHLEYYLSNTIINHQSHAGKPSNTNTLSVINLKNCVKKRKKKKKLAFVYGSSWCYEPVSKYRAKGHFFISKQLTNDIIPNMVKENICNVWQFMDKTSAILQDYGCLIQRIKHLNKRIKVINYGFHEKDTGHKLYCVLEENLDKNINYEWIMMGKLFDCKEMEKEFKIKCDKLPVSVSETVEYKLNILNGDKIKEIMKNKEKMRRLILNTKWHKIPIKNKEKLTKKRMTLAINKEEFIKNVLTNNNINDSKPPNDINLVPIIMFHNKNNKYRMEYIWIIRIDINIHVGISLIYNANNCNIPLQIGAIHLNKTFISNQYELISNGNGVKLQCLQQFTSIITNLNIGNPDDCTNRLKDLRKRNQDLRDEKQELRVLNEKLLANNKELQQIKQMYYKLMANKSAPIEVNPVNNVNVMSPFNQILQNNKNVQ